MLPITQQDAGKRLDVGKAGNATMRGGDGLLRSFETLMCGSGAAKKRTEAPAGFLVSVAVDTRRNDGGRGGDLTQFTGEMCSVCGARCSALCEQLGSERWRCNFCGKENVARGGGGSGGVATRVPLSYSFRDMGAGDGVRGGGTGTAVVFLVDTAIEKDELAMLKAAIRRAIRAMHDSTWIGIVEARRAAVGFYDIGETRDVTGHGGLISCTMLPTASVAHVDAAHDPDLERLLRTALSFRRILRPLRECRQTALAVVKSLRCCHRFTRWHERQVSLGGALQCIVKVLPPSTPSASDPQRAIGPATRVVCCVAGPSTVGIGALVPDNDDSDVFDPANEEARRADAHAELSALGRRLHTAGMTVDVFVGGQRAVNVPGVSRMATLTGGSVLLHDDFGFSFARNLENLVVGTENVGATSIRVVLHGALRVSDWFGPVDHASQREKSGGSGALAYTVNSIHASSRIASVGLCQRHVGISLDSARAAGGDRGGADIQVTVSRQTKDETRGKVFTFRVMTHASLPLFVRDMYQEISAVLVGKRAVAHIDTDTVPDVEAQLDSAREMVGRAMLDVAAALAQDTARGRPVLSHALLPFASRLYFLCHGALLGDVLRHQDEKVALWSLFLKSGMDFCDRVLAPTLLSFPSGMRVFEELPAVSLALCSSAVLMMDCGTHVLLWIGALVREDDVAVHAALEHADAIAAARYPSPTRVVASEGSSASRYMLARLIPVHQDLTTEQVAQLPVLGGMKSGDLESLQSRFLMTDVPSFYRWLRDAGIEPPIRVERGDHGDGEARRSQVAAAPRGVSHSARERPTTML